MAGAGFYAIHTDTITFGKDGRWYADGEPIVHPRLALLFSRHLRRKPDGEYEISIDDRYRADVIVEDTPFVIVGLDGSAESGFALLLNDETREALEPDTLETAHDNVLYARVKGGAHPARFTRSAYMHLANAIEPTDDGGFALRVAGTAHPIRVRA